MLEAALEALSIILDPSRFGWIVLGVAMGLVVGLIPGLNGVTGMSLLLPFVFGMDPASGIAMLIGLLAVVSTSDTFPAVLIGIPGTAGAQATIMDGYPLARSGQAGRALGAAFISSMLGGVFGAIILFAGIWAARPLILSMRSPDLFILALLGLCLVGVLSRGKPVAGILSGAMGLLLGTIGSAPATGAPRFTFGDTYLYGGIPLAVLAMGLFAIPELTRLMTTDTSVARAGKLQGGLLSGAREALRHKRLMLRSSALGAGLGIIPGIGGSVVDWITYAVATKGKENEELGSGNIRGVIAPESANNAKDGGGLVPTLLFGIPGSGGGAMMLVALTLFGIEAGPSMVGENLPITLTIAWTLAIANIIGAAACFAFAPLAARVSLIPGRKLVPVLLVFMVIAAYQSSGHIGDVILFFAIGILGLAMVRAGWPRPPLMIGFVLAGPAERYLHLSITRYGWDWLAFPSVIVCTALIVGVCAYAAVRTRKAPDAAILGVVGPSDPSNVAPDSDAR